MLKLIILFVVVFSTKVFAECGEACKNKKDFLSKNSVCMINEGLQWLCSPPDETPFKLIVSDGKITFISTDSSDGREPFAFPFIINPDFGWLVDPESEELSCFNVLSGKLCNEEEFFMTMLGSPIQKQTVFISKL